MKYAIELNLGAKVNQILAANGEFYSPDMVGRGGYALKVYSTRSGAEKFAARRPGKYQVVEINW